MADLTTKGHSVVVGYHSSTTTLSAVTSATSGFTAVGLLVNLPAAPSPEAEDIDIGHMTSEEQYDEWAAGWADAGEVELDVQYVKTTQAALIALFRQQRTWRITFADNSVWAFNGYIKGYGQPLDRKGYIHQTLKIKVNGKPYFNAAA